ncbi:TIGR02757 family protein [Croceimicrobium sp.]|uniref:TIGR02757 family protein n=1 Tax=Croceimicrobium sp. TaxID=2828340 RepID=UPI003BAC5887
MKIKELKDFLDRKAAQYEARSFLDEDPIQIPHRYSRKEDIEIMGLLTATIAWGNRKSIIRSALNIAELLDEAPFEFVMQHEESDLKALPPFVHRTFQLEDLQFFLRALKNIYQDKGGLERAFNHPKGMKAGIEQFREHMFSIPHAPRSEKHISSPFKNSAAKRLNMYLRWMVRPSTAGVDFGLWQQINTSALYCPLDVHSGRVARKLGLLKRQANDWKANEELRTSLLNFDRVDPVKYDFALFGLGIFEKF